MKNLSLSPLKLAGIACLISAMTGQVIDLMQSGMPFLALLLSFFLSGGFVNITIHLAIRRLSVMIVF